MSSALLPLPSRAPIPLPTYCLPKLRWRWGLRVHVLRRAILLSFIPTSTSWFQYLIWCCLWSLLCVSKHFGRWLIFFLGRSPAIPPIDFIMGGRGNDGDGDWAVLPCPPLAEVTLALVGKIGTGKSATANCILGKETFASERSYVSVTETCQKSSTMFHDGCVTRTVNVIDTPGNNTQLNWLRVCRRIPTERSLFLLFLKLLKTVSWSCIQVVYSAFSNWMCWIHFVGELVSLFLKSSRTIMWEL